MHFKAASLVAENRGNDNTSFMAHDYNLLILHRLARVAALFTIGIGIIVLLGWWLDLPVLYQVAPTLPAVPPNAGLVFILLGASLYWAQPTQVLRKFYHYLGQTLALASLVIGLLSLLNYAPVPIDIPIDQLLTGLFAVTPSVLALSPQVAFAFVLASIGLLLLSLNQPVLTRLVQVGAFGALMLMVVVFLGYAHLESRFYIAGGSIGIGIQSVTALVAFGWGVILTRVEQSFLSLMAEPTSGGLVVRRMMLLVILIPILLGWLPLVVHSTYFTHIQIESLLASGLLFVAVLTVLSLAHRLDMQEIQWRKAEQKSLSHQAKLAHVLRLSTMGEMASGIAHELNQPLAAVANYSGACQRMIRNGCAAEQLLEPLENIQKQALRASEIIRRLRAFISKQLPNKTAGNLNELVQEAVGLLRDVMTINQVKINMNLAANMPNFKVDAIQIEQIIINILQNAIDALQVIDSAERHIQVTTHVKADGTLQTDITDSGPGMDEALTKRIFEPFVTTKGKDGMGIGLALCRSVIEAHGGRLWVQSALGQGSTFSFSLPVRDE